MNAADRHPWLGRAVYIRTLGEAWIGRLAEVTPLELVLEDASWLANAGRLDLTLDQGIWRATARGENDEPRDVVHFHGAVRVGRGHVTSWTPFVGADGREHRLPAESGVIDAR